MDFIMLQHNFEGFGNLSGPFVALVGIVVAGIFASIAILSKNDATKKFTEMEKWDMRIRQGYLDVHKGINNTDDE